MKTGALWTILIITAIIVFIASLKATVVISYSDELRLWVRVLFFKINILPQKKKKRGAQSMSARKAERIRKKLRKKAEKKKLTAKEKEQEKKAEKGKKKEPREIVDNIKMITSLAVLVVERFFKHLRIRLARIKIIVATGDAASTAVMYGAITQSLNILLPLLESVKCFEKLPQSDISVDLDYLAEEPTVDIKLMFSLRVWHTLDIGLSALKTFLKHKFAQMSRDDRQSEASAKPKSQKKKNHKL
ncbi:MAG: hypothetical protein J6A83_04680 [Clostridia bacterium]|nr:hypothetical protein [Clostridia bacterium]